MAQTHPSKRKGLQTYADELESSHFAEFIDRYGEAFFKTELASFLTLSDLLSLRLVNSCLSLCEVVTSDRDFSLPKTYLSSWNRTIDCYHAEEWYTLPIDVLSAKVHTVIFHGEWRDQGWGNRKGMVAIVAKGEGHRAPNDYKSPGPGVVAHLATAPHRWEPFRLEFRPDPSHHSKNVDGGEEYDVWIRNGGGGGHSLSLRNLKMAIVTKRWH